MEEKEMKKLLLLDYRCHADISDIKKAAYKAGWETRQTNKFQVADHIRGYDLVRYYGNTIHAAQIEDQLPFTFSKIDYSALAKIPQCTNRNIHYHNFGDLKQPITKDIFIKPVREKLFDARIYKKGETITESPPLDSKIYISDIIDFRNEVRCFILDGKVATSSLYIIGKEIYSDITENANFDKWIDDTEIPQIVEFICSKFAMPRGFVIDFGVTADRKLSIVEFNEAPFCSLYHCNPDKCLDAIIASVEDKNIIPPEIGQTISKNLLDLI